MGHQFSCSVLFHFTSPFESLFTVSMGMSTCNTSTLLLHPLYLYINLGLWCMNILSNTSGGPTSLLGPTVYFLQASTGFACIFPLLHAPPLTFSFLGPRFSPQAMTFHAAGDRITLGATLFLSDRVIIYVDLSSRCLGWSIDHALKIGPKGQIYRHSKLYRHERLLRDSSNIHTTHQSVNENSCTFTTINMLVPIKIIKVVKYHE
jgi:hypothetical protein